MRRSLTPPALLVAPLTSPAFATENPACSLLVAPARANPVSAAITLFAPAVSGSDDVSSKYTAPLAVLVVPPALRVLKGSPMAIVSTPSAKRLGTSAKDVPSPVGVLTED